MIGIDGSHVTTDVSVLRPTKSFLIANMLKILVSLCTYVYACYISYTAKFWSGKNFTVVHKIHHSPENFRGLSGRCHHVLYIASDSRGKLSRSAEKPQKFPT